MTIRMTEHQSPWWMGLRADHLYENCPVRLRSLTTLRRFDLNTGPGRDPVDPLGTDICGWCARVWAARNQVCAA